MRKNAAWLLLSKRAGKGRHELAFNNQTPAEGSGEGGNRPYLCPTK
jgi:hypothetical protein